MINFFIGIDYTQNKRAGLRPLFLDLDLYYLRLPPPTNET
jgi:hypothetical protein